MAKMCRRFVWFRGSHLPEHVISSFFQLLVPSVPRISHKCASVFGEIWLIVGWVMLVACSQRWRYLALVVSFWGIAEVAGLGWCA